MQDETLQINKENLYTGFKVLLKYLGQYKRSIVILSIMGIFSAIGNGVIPYIAGKFFDAIITPSNVNFLDYTIALYLVLLIVWFVVQLITYILDWRINITSEYLSNTIWLDYLAKGFGFLLNLPMSFHKKNKIGEIGNKINTAAGALETIAGRIVIDLAPQILSIIIALGIALYLKPLLAIILLIGLLTYVFVLISKVKPLAGIQKEYWEQISFLWGDAFDVIGNTLAIKQSTAEEYEQKKISDKTKLAVPLWMKMTKVWGTLNLYQRFTILITQIIARQWQTIQNGIVNIQETEKILQIDPENYQPKDAVTLDLQGNIEFKNVNFYYEKEKPVLQDISFSVKAGQVIALVGESGVGKSTLIDLISAYNFPIDGTILIDGHEIQKINLKQLRSQIAVVPQEVVLFNDTIKINIKYGNFSATDDEMISASKKAHALDFIEKFPDRWEQVVGERGVKLSVGQKQRVAITRAILRNPKILILDEPTSALDAGSEKIITKSLEELMQGKTTFIIAHRLSTVRKADKILVFKDGRIIESGTHAELSVKQGGEYKRLYDLQIGLVE